MSDNIQAAVLAEYAASQGYKTAYTLGSNEIPYTKNLPIYFADAFEHGGGTVVGSDQYKIGAGDYSAAVTKLASVNPPPDVVFTPMFIPDSVVFFRQLRQAGLTMPVLSTDGNADAALLDAGAKAIDGLTFTNSVCTAEGDPGVKGFYTDYNAEYGKDPSSYVAVIGYDEINILRSAIEAANSAAPADIIAALANVDYTGISGHVVMDPTTRRVNKPAAIVRWRERRSHACPRRPSPATSRPRSERSTHQSRGPGPAGGLTGQPLLAVQGLTVAYGAVVAVREVSLDVEAGGVVAALGPNGAGKTTLLRAIAGALKAQSGTVMFDGRSLIGMVPEDVVRTGIALVPEGRHVFPKLTVEENLVIEDRAQGPGAAPLGRRPMAFSVPHPR